MRERTTALLVAGIIALLAAAPLVARAGDADECASAAEEAQPLRKDGKLSQAREKLLVCARPHCPVIVRNDCIRWLAEVESSLPTVVLRAVDENGRDLLDVRVTLDDKMITEKLDGKAVALDPGAHTFRFEAKDREPVVEQVLVRQGEVNRIVSARLPPAAGLKPPPPPPVEPEGKRIPTTT